MVDFRLKVFYNVAKLRSFSGAGKVLFITQPAVSAQIKSLEEEFEAKLFVRKPRKLILTPEGQILFDYTKKILKLYEDAEKEIVELSDSLKGKLTIGATSTIASYYLPLIIAGYKKKYPYVEIITLTSNTEIVVESMNKGIVDFCVVSEPVHERHFYNQTFIKDELVLIVSPKHKWADKKSITLQQLIEEPLILREKGSGTRETLQQYLKAKGKKFENLNVIMTLGTTSSVKAAVGNDLGIALVPKTAVKLELKVGWLKLIPIRNMPMTQTFTVLYHKGFNKPISENFFNFMQNFHLSLE